jgi:hypothetical protein
VFDEDDEEVIEAHAAEAGREEGDAELRPFHGSSAEHGGGEEGEGGGEGGEEEDDALGGASSWNLRKCSAAGLDMLSNVFGDELLPVLLPIVEGRLREAQWAARESAMLALGEPPGAGPRADAGPGLLLGPGCCWRRRLGWAPSLPPCAVSSSCVLQPPGCLAQAPP